MQVGAKFKKGAIPMENIFEGKVAKDKVMVFTDDAENDSRYNKEHCPCHVDCVRSIMSAPITSQTDELLGIISCYNKLDPQDNQKIAFSKEDSEYIIHITVILAGFMSKRRLLIDKEKERKRAESISVLMQYQKKINCSQHNPEKLRKLLCQVSDSIMSVDLITIFAVDSVKEKLVCLTSENNFAKNYRISFSTGAVGDVVRGGRTRSVQISELYSDFDKRLLHQSQSNAEKVMLIPIRGHDKKVFAVLELLHGCKSGYCDSIDDEILNIFNDQSKYDVYESNHFYFFGSSHHFFH